MRVFVGERDLPGLRVWQTATVRLDGLEDRTFRGRILSIADRAEFTPRVAFTEDERADLVFGVKVALEDTTGTIKPGLPATVTFESTRRTPPPAPAAP